MAWGPPVINPNHECFQEVNLAKLTMATETLTKSVDQLISTSQEQNQILRSLATQAIRLDAVEGRVGKVEHDVDGIYDRVRAVELFQAKRSGEMGITEEEAHETKVFRNTVKAGLVVAILISTFAALLWLLDKNDYMTSFSTTKTYSVKPAIAR